MNSRSELENMGFKVSKDFEETMDIETPPGSLVTFHAAGGHDHEQEDAKKVLSLGETYIVENIEISSWSSKVKLRGIEGTFNTCLFGPAIVPSIGLK